MIIKRKLAAAAMTIAPAPATTQECAWYSHEMNVDNFLDIDANVGGDGDFTTIWYTPDSRVAKKLDVYSWLQECRPDDEAERAEARVHGGG